MTDTTNEIKPASAASRAEGANLTDVLAADANRYRWIRENISADLEWYLFGMHGMGSEGLDEAIDAAIVKAANV